MLASIIRRPGATSGRSDRIPPATSIPSRDLVRLRTPEQARGAPLETRTRRMRIPHCGSGEERGKHRSLRTGEARGIGSEVAFRGCSHAIDLRTQLSHVCVELENAIL